VALGLPQTVVRRNPEGAVRREDADLLDQRRIAVEDVDQLGRGQAGREPLPAPLERGDGFGERPRDGGRRPRRRARRAVRQVPHGEFVVILDQSPTIKIKLLNKGGNPKPF